MPDTEHHNRWQQFIGRPWIVERLAAEISNDRTGHAYLFSGPPHSGKTLLATLFAMALNCLDSVEQRPCGHCRSCRLIEANRHPDVIMLEPQMSARGKQSIKIDAVRELQRRLQYAPLEGRYQVAILTGFEAANINAANAFLKTLEEPPADTVLILTATDADALLETVRSRCRSMSIRNLGPDRLAAALSTRFDAPPEQVQLVARLSGGRPGWAIRALSDDQLLTERQQRLELLSDSLAIGLVERFKLADRLARRPEQLTVLLNAWLTWWRDLLLIERGADAAIVNVDRRAELSSLSGRWSADALHTALTQTQTALWQLERNANTLLVLENLLLAYPSLPMNMAY